MRLPRANGQRCLCRRGHARCCCLVVYLTLVRLQVGVEEGVESVVVVGGAVLRVLLAVVEVAVVELAVVELLVIGLATAEKAVLTVLLSVLEVEIIIGSQRLSWWYLRRVWLYLICVRWKWSNL